MRSQQYLIAMIIITQFEIVRSKYYSIEIISIKIKLCLNQLTNNNNQRTAKFSELQQKGIKTILKANHLLLKSKETFEQLLSSDKMTMFLFQDNIEYIKNNNIELLEKKNNNKDKELR